MTTLLYFTTVQYSTVVYDDDDNAMQHNATHATTMRAASLQ
jgi:hypothetical protein